MLTSAQLELLRGARRPAPSADGTYSDEQRETMAGAAMTRAIAGLPKDVALVLVVATRTADDKSRFHHVTNMQTPRDSARLMTRAALVVSPDGLDDVLASEIAKRTTKTDQQN